VEIWEKELNKSPISIDDNFFNIGGHSLKAIAVVNNIHQVFGVKISIRELFQFKTVSELARFIRESEVTGFEDIEKIQEAPYYEMSYSQKRLWYLHQLEPNNPVFNMPIIIRLLERVDQEIVSMVLNRVIERHESFRTTFKVVGKEAVQVIAPVDSQPGTKCEILDFTALDHQEKEKIRVELMKEESTHFFNLEEGPLFKAKLVKWAEEEFDLIINMHHIITDGWSIEVLGREFTLLYEAYKKKMPWDTGSLKIQYKDYAAWQNRLLGDPTKLGKAKEFWKQYLDLNDPLPGLNLPYDFSPGAQYSKRSSAFYHFIDESTAEGLRELARRQGGSLFMVLLAGFYLLLQHITGQEDIVIAIPAAARQHWRLKDMVGMFVNTLVLRQKTSRDDTFTNFFQAVRVNTFKALEYQDYPMELIFNELKMKYPEVNVFFNMLNLGADRQKKIEAESRDYHIDEVQSTKFPILCYIKEYQNSIEVACHYFKSLFSPATIETVMKLYSHILENIAKDPDKKTWEYTQEKKKRKIF